MALTGQVAEVITETPSAALLGNYPANAGTLTVDNATQFPSAGSIRVEDISTGTLVTEDLEYLIDDPSLPNRLNLYGVSTYPYTDGSIVTLINPVIPSTSVAVVTDASQPPLLAVASQEMVTVHAVALAEGPRDNGAGASVQVEEIAGEWRITKVLAQAAISGPSITGLLPGDTLPPGVAPDGITPSDPRTITVSPFAVGAVRADWQADTTNANPVTYLIHASLTSPVPEDGSALVGKTTGTNFQISRVGGAMIPIDTSQTPTQPTVYVKVQSSDVDGLGVFSAEGSATVLASDNMITAAWVKALEIEAQQIVAGSIIANIGVLATLNVGGYVVVDGVTSSITIYADVLHTIPLVQLRPDGSVFRGQIIASDVSVLNGLILTGIQSQIAQGAALTMMNGVADPTSAPTLSQVLINSVWPGPRSGFTERGISWDSTDNCWLRLLVPPPSNVDGDTKIEKISAAGAHIADITLGNIPSIGEDDFNGVIRVGSSYYVAFEDDRSSGSSWDVGVAKFSLTGTYQAAVNSIATFSHAYSGRGVNVGYDGTNIMLAVSDDSTGFSIYFRDPTTLAAAVGVSTLTNTGSMTATAIHKVGYGTYDFGGGSYYWVGSGGTERFYTVSGTTLVEDTTKSFVSAPGTSLTIGGIGWNGSAFYASQGGTMLGKFSKWYQNYVGPGYDFAWVGYEDFGTSPARDTRMSPVASFAVRDRFWLQITLPPSAASGSRVLYAHGLTQPTDDLMLVRSETLTAGSMVIDPSVAGSGSHPTLRNITTKAVAGGVATLGTSSAHGYAIGHSVSVAGVGSPFDGSFVVTAVPDSTHFSYAVVSADISSTAASGLVTANTFGAGSPGVFQAQTGGFIVRGDSSGGWDKRDDRITPTIANISPASTTAKIVAQWVIPPGWFAASRLARIILDSQVSSTATITWKIYMGTAGDNTDPLLVQFDTSPSNTGTLAHAMMDAYVRCIDASHMAAFGFVTNGVDLGDGMGPVNGVTTNAAVDTTIGNFLSVEAKLGSSNTLTTNIAYLEKLRG